MGNLKELYDEISPNRCSLVEKDEGGFTSEIIDCELDLVKLEFNGDDSIIIHTPDYQYITLDRGTIETLLDLLDDENEQISNHGR